MQDEILKFLKAVTKLQLMELYSGPLVDSVHQGLATWTPKSYEDITLMFMGITRCTEEQAIPLMEELVEWAWDSVMFRKLEDKKLRLKKMARQGANRAIYTFEPLFEFYEWKDRTWRWKWGQELRSFGLVRLMVEQIHGPQAEPTALAILHRKPPRFLKDEELRLWHEAMSHMVASGVTVSGGRLGWNRNSPGWSMVINAFPNAVDCSAYNHGLNAPVIPEGFLPEVNITLRKLTHPETGEDLCTDGSGIYHPEAPQMKEFVAKYGVVACQPRGIHPGNGDNKFPQGLFVKGVLFPSTHAVDEDGNPTICFDWAQVKGRWKDPAKKCRAEDKVLTVEGMYLGLLQCWNEPQKLSGCFELLENIQVTERTIELTERLVDKAMDKLEVKGLDGLVAEVCAKDESLSMIHKLTKLANEAGLPIKPYDIPRVRTAMTEALGKKLWKIGDSAGIKLPSYVCRLDASVPPGKAVMWGMPAGKKVVGFRFPLILAQGLISLETIEPPAHLLVNDELCPYSVVMNPADLTTGMQGDDDGDFAGFTTDPSIVELFSNRLEESRYHIEPKGEIVVGSDNKPLKTNTVEGLEFLKHDHRGIVGRCTVWRARLLAVGDFAAARAMSIAIQECVDAAKRRPAWSDIREAVHLSKWTVDENGEYHFSIRFKQSELENGGFPEKLIKKWVDQRLIAMGCCDIVTDDDGKEKVIAVNPLWYRNPEKKVMLDNWFQPSPDPKFENLVHVAFRRAHERWHKFADEFIKTDEFVTASNILPMVLAHKGIHAPVQPMTWEEYRNGLRVKLGIKKYADEWRRLQAQSNDEEGFKHKLLKINEVNKNLNDTLLKGLISGNITMSDIVTSWILEWANAPAPGEDPRDKGNPNHAVRIVCFEGSPIMEALGLTEKPSCKFLYKGEQDRLKFVLEACISKPEPHAHLARIINKNTSHGRENTTPDGEPIELHECRECTLELQNKLVQYQRILKGGPEQEYLSGLLRKVKSFRS